jgi:hypothetical protein
MLDVSQKHITKGCNPEQVFTVPTLTLNIVTGITESTIHNLSFPIIIFFLFRNCLYHFLRLVFHLYSRQNKNSPWFLNSIFFVQLSNLLNIISLLVELYTIQNFSLHRVSLNFKTTCISFLFSLYKGYLPFAPRLHDSLNSTFSYFLSKNTISLLSHMVQQNMCSSFTPHFFLRVPR